MRLLRSLLGLLVAAVVLALAWYFFGLAVTGGRLHFKPLSGPITVLHYPSRSMDLFLNCDDHLVGYEQFCRSGTSFRGGSGAVAVSAGPTALGIAFGASRADVTRRFGAAFAVSASSYAYWPVLAEEVDVRKGLRYFHFAENRLDRAGEMFTRFRLADGVSYGCSRAAVIKAYGTPASVEITREPPLVQDFIPRS